MQEGALIKDGLVCAQVWVTGKAYCRDRGAYGEDLRVRHDATVQEYDLPCHIQTFCRFLQSPAALSRARHAAVVPGLQG